MNDGSEASTLTEEAIRPAAIFDEFLRLCARDATRFFEGQPRQPTPCPACLLDGRREFDKGGFQYVQCTSCRSLFVSPRPTADAFARYYTESESSRYWASTFYRETAAARREHLWRPKARRLAAMMERLNAAGPVIDIGGGYGLFAEEMTAITGREVTVIEPAAHLAASCRARGITVVEKFIEDVGNQDLPPGTRTFVSFELFEHLHDPNAFLRSVRALMRPAELFMFTTLSGAGLDVRVLWQHSKSVAPPHHLNFMTPPAVRSMLANAGFTSIEVTTPGQLDLDILSNNRELIEDRFWSAFTAHADAAQRAIMQDAIAGAGFSSHMMAVCFR